MTELNFKGKEFVYNHHLAVPFRPLVPHEDKGIGPVALDGNLVIHGDNLHALKSLLPLCAGKVDCIFIDPPYNTGNEGWCYNDNVNAPMIKEWLDSNPVGIEDGLRHDGQEDSCWAVTTTLERSPDGLVSMPFLNYYLSIYRAKHAIESYTEKSWDVPDPSGVKNLTERVGLFVSSTKEAFEAWGQAWSYMVHLRHYGFPSPFLDWTRSPYVAAFFAFRRPIMGVKKYLSTPIVKRQMCVIIPRASLVTSQRYRNFGSNTLQRTEGTFFSSANTQCACEIGKENGSLCRTKKCSSATISTTTFFGSSAFPRRSV